MSVTISSPVTGAAQTGFTSPTYTIVADSLPASVAGKQYYVSALGGTQASVDVHSVAKPFTISVFRPPVLKVLPNPNPLTGIIKNVPVNNYKIITRKGAVPYANQQPQMILIRTTIEVPAGVETYEPEELRAALSLHIGALSANASGIGDTAVTGSV